LIFCPLLDPWRTLAVLALEAGVGYPDRLHRLLPHPVVWAGRGIASLERQWNLPQWPAALRRLLGVATLILIAGPAAAIGLLIDHWAEHSIWLVLVTILIGTTGLAQRSLYAHVAAIRDALRADDLPRARIAVGHIVGRDVQVLDVHGVAAAALESLAESFCDGIVAPAFWLLLGGLGGLFAYKAVNTADSLIGHREPRWRAFGWAAARTDDVMNLIPARLAGGLLAVAGRGGWRIMLRDAKKHDSPNAGWPEAAMAGGLGIRLGGAVAYDGVMHPRPWFGDGKQPDAADLDRGLRIYVGACLLLWAVLAAGGFAWRN
jgi:adenosylcobinamide-phosphate synthase